jgi:anti-sigma regulatory factor (Ser/Thr protein kinase)
MNVMAPTRPTELDGYRVRLTTGPAAAGQARSEVRAAVQAWAVPVDAGVAVLLTSELVTNAVAHEASQTVTLAITCSCGQLRVEVHDTSPSLPVLADAPADAEAGRGLMLVATLSAEWGVYRTAAGKAVYFTLACQPDHAQDGERGPQGLDTWGLPAVSPAGWRSPLDAPVIPRARSPRRERAQGRLTGDIGPRMDVELLQDVGDVGRDGPPG